MIQIFEKLAAISFFSGFAILIIVGWFNLFPRMFGSTAPYSKAPLSSIAKRFSISGFCLIGFALILIVYLVLFEY